MSALIPTPQDIWSVLFCFSPHSTCIWLVSNVHAPCGSVLEYPLDGARDPPDATGHDDYFCARHAKGSETLLKNVWPFCSEQERVVLYLKSLGNSFWNSAFELDH